MSFCSSTGLIITPYCFLDGKLSDNSIFKDIFMFKIPHYFPFLEMIKNTKTLIIVDRGFASFLLWFKEKQSEDPKFFPKLSFEMPVNRFNNETGQYFDNEVNESRARVTSSRAIVENIHAMLKQGVIC